MNGEIQDLRCASQCAGRFILVEKSQCSTQIGARVPFFKGRGVVLFTEFLSTGIGNHRNVTVDWGGVAK